MLERRSLGNVQGSKGGYAFKRQNRAIGRGAKSKRKLNLQVVLGHQEKS